MQSANEQAGEGEKGGRESKGDLRIKKGNGDQRGSCSRKRTIRLRKDNGAAEDRHGAESLLFYC